MVCMHFLHMPEMDAYLYMTPQKVTDYMREYCRMVYPERKTKTATSVMELMRGR